MWNVDLYNSEMNLALVHLLIRAHIFLFDIYFKGYEFY